MFNARPNQEYTFRYTPAGMQVDVSRVQARAAVTILRPHGRINLGNAGQLVEKARQVHASGSRHLIIDLAEVPSLTSAGLRAIQSIHQIFEGKSLPSAKEATGKKAGHARRRSDHFKLIHPNAELRRVLVMAGFDQHIEILPSRQEALQAF